MKPGSKKIDKSLDVLLSQNTKLDAGLNSLKLEKIWNDIMPQEVLDYTKSIKFSKGIMKIQITSSSLRQNLLYKSDELRIQINALLNSDKVESIKIN